jgi:hypothetical protein
MPHNSSIQAGSTADSNPVNTRLGVRDDINPDVHKHHHHPATTATEKTPAKVTHRGEQVDKDPEDQAKSSRDENLYDRGTGQTSHQV